MMRQAGRYLPEYREIRAKHTFLEVCKTPELAVEVSLQPFRRLGVDAVIVFSDILIPAEAMGLKLELGDAGPNLPEPVRTKADVERLRLFDPEMETGFLAEAIRRIVREVGGDVPVLGFAAAPWTLACYMVEGRASEGFASVKSLLYHEPRTLHELLHRIAEATIPYLKAQIAAGAAAVQLFDTWCGELPLRDYEDFALPATQEIVSGLGGKVPIIYIGGQCTQRGLARESAGIAGCAGPARRIAGECRPGGVVWAPGKNPPSDPGDNFCASRGGPHFEPWTWHSPEYAGRECQTFY